MYICILIGFVLLQLQPGLSSYAEDPQAAANSLVPLLDKAEIAVPVDLRSKTPATGRGHWKAMQPTEFCKRDLLKERSALKLDANGVRILDGSKEGYAWVTINYLLGNLGGTYQDTVGIADLGGGSVQMAYAISEDAASKAPSAPDGEENYLELKVWRHLMFSGNPCILEGFDEAAQRACGTKYGDAKAFPDFSEEDLAYICMDLVYLYTLLTDGFGLDPYQISHW
ncbi:putative apyrase 2 [Hibiscus syriacus]|uniref:apyrase n=1 Tax=Hibiscus syriacus TaxID=106335 RepID=A0A6A2YXB9_HIBSY|nr:putative apyrase 2 [Hibiscus syriacus]